MCYLRQKTLRAHIKVLSRILHCRYGPESPKLKRMNTKEIERAIVQLPSPEIAKLAEWFRTFQAQVWEQQIERDVQAGRLDALIEQAENEFQAGRCQPL